MPYHVGERGTGGCKNGYPVVKDSTGEVIACHDTRASAEDQIIAINLNETKGDWGITPTQTTSDNAIYPNIGVKAPKQGRAGGTTGSNIKSKYGKQPKKTRRGRSSDALGSDGAIATTSGTSMGTKSDEAVSWELNLQPVIKGESVIKQGPCWDGYTQRGMKPGDNGKMVPNCVPISKADAAIVEGDFVLAMTTEGPIVGQVEHVMLEGGTYGEPENPYSVESTPENPAVAIRMLEEEDGMYYYTPYSIGALMSNITRIPMPEISLEDYEDKESMNKEDGKATGAGTAVGWTRAGQLARGETLSLSTVKRMYSYFSRHEVDKKGKDWGNTANPSNGYIMWLAWGGDAGFSWSRGIVQREAKKFWDGSAFGQK
jgi:hypothetical protein